MGFWFPYPLTDLVIADPKLVMEEAIEAKKPPPFFGSLGGAITTADYRKLSAPPLEKNRSRNPKKKKRETFVEIKSDSLWDGDGDEGKEIRKKKMEDQRRRRRRKK